MRILTFILVVWASIAAAVEPDEVLEDPALEERARALSQGLRCTVCQNESIDESSAPVARDLRLLVRERLVAGDTDSEVLDFVVARYGEFVLLRPRTDGGNLVLWLVGPVVLVLTLGGFAVAMRRKPEADPLSEDEKARVAKLLGEGKPSDPA